MKRSWYAFYGGDDPLNEKNYIKMPVGPLCLCGDKICAIYVYSESRQLNQPLTNNLQQYIKDALATRFIQPEYPFDAKKFVYLKDF